MERDCEYLRLADIAFAVLEICPKPRNIFSFRISLGCHKREYRPQDLISKPLIARTHTLPQIVCYVLDRRMAVRQKVALTDWYKFVVVSLAVFEGHVFE